MPVFIPLMQLSMAALRGVARAFGAPAIRRWVLPIIAYEGAGYLLDFLFFTIKVRASNFFISRQDDSTEASAFLAWAELDQEEVDNMPKEQAQGLVNRYVDMREKAEPASRLGAALLGVPSHG